MIKVVLIIQNVILGKPTIILTKLRSYVDSDDIRASEEDLEELKRTPRFTIHGGISDDPSILSPDDQI